MKRIMILVGLVVVVTGFGQTSPETSPDQMQKGEKLTMTLLSISGRQAKERAHLRLRSLVRFPAHKNHVTRNSDSPRGFSFTSYETQNEYPTAEPTQYDHRATPYLKVDPGNEIEPNNEDRKFTIVIFFNNTRHSELCDPPFVSGAPGFGIQTWGLLNSPIVYTLVDLVELRASPEKKGTMTLRTKDDFLVTVAVELGPTS